MRGCTHTEKTCTSKGSGLKSPCSTGFIFLILFPVMLLHQGYTFSQDHEATPFKISVFVRMITLNATVLDSKGNQVSGLTKEDFQVYEDGIIQEIEYFGREDIPVTVGIVIDNSGTMKPKRAEVIAAALAFARASNPKDQMFVVHFNENISLGLPDSMLFTDKVDQLENALSRINANGLTALYDAVAMALDHLNKGDLDKKALIVIADGEDNASKQSQEKVLAAADKSNAIIFTIDIFDETNPDRNPRVLKQLAKTTGGEAFLPDSITEIVSICKRIALDIRSQYSIAYIPTNNTQDGKFRALKVTARTRDGRRLFVRTRTGYFAPFKTQPIPANERPHENAN
jgi:Ca-activated chloride channel homolog